MLNEKRRHSPAEKAGTSIVIDLNIESSWVVTIVEGLVYSMLFKVVWNRRGASFSISENGDGSSFSILYSLFTRSE